MADKKTATTHNGRKSKKGAYSDRHDDRNYDYQNEENINPEKTKDNIYYYPQDDGSIKTFTHEERQQKKIPYFRNIELKFYEKHFIDKLIETNEKYIQERHPELVKTMKEYKNTHAPEETIFQIGNAEDGSVGMPLLKEIFDEYTEWKQKEFPNVYLLNAAIHLDETTEHIQAREAYIGHDEYGKEIPNQTKALDEMGIMPPKIYKPEDIDAEELKEQIAKKERESKTNLKKLTPEEIEDKINDRINNHWEEELKKAVYDKNHSQHNNPKMTYTRKCRDKWIEICKSKGIEIEEVPKTPGKKTMELMEWQIKKDIKKLEMLKEEKEKDIEEIRALKTERKNIKAENIELKKQNNDLIEKYKAQIDTLTNDMEDIKAKKEEAVKELNMALTEKDKANEKCNAIKQMAKQTIQTFQDIMSNLIPKFQEAFKKVDKILSYWSEEETKTYLHYKEALDKPMNEGQKALSKAYGMKMDTSSLPKIHTDVMDIAKTLKTTTKQIYDVINEPEEEEDYER